MTVYTGPMSDTERDLPSEVSDGEPGVFDRFADAVARRTAKAWFFAACLGLVIIWAPSIFFLPSVDTWQLIINTATTIVTFLLVGLMQNATARANAAIHQKLNALAKFHLDTAPNRGFPGVAAACDELSDVFGLERREGS